MKLNYSRHWYDYLAVALTIAAFLSILELIYPLYFFKNDNIDSYVCVYKYAFESLTKGDVALYNFHQFLGTPFFAQGQNGSVYLPALISVFLSESLFTSAHYSVEISMFIHLMIAGVSMYRLCEKLSVKRTVSFIASVSWALNSFTIYEGRVWLIVVIASAWLPLMICTTLNLIDNGNLRTYLLAAIPRAIFFYGGHPQFWTYAVIFEFLFFSLLTVITYYRNKLQIRTILFRYVISYIPTTLICLPLLLPMWKVMSTSSSRSAALDVESFLAHNYDIRSLLIGILFPFMQIDGFEAKNTFEEIAINASHYGYVLFFATVFFIIMTFRSLRNGKKEPINNIALASLSSLIIGVLWECSKTVNRLIYFIPILNRFRWPYKLNIEVMFFAVLLGAVCLNCLTKNLKAKRMPLISITLIGVTILNFAFLYMVIPPKYHGVRVEGDYTAHHEYYELLSDKRYVSIGFPQWTFNEDLSQEPASVEELNFNTATYFGLENYSGYDVMSSQNEFEENGEFELIPLTGSICNPTDAFIDHMRQLGVSIYLVSDYAHFDQYNEESFTREAGNPEITEYLLDHGMTELYSEGTVTVFSDPEALFPVYYISDNMPIAAQYSIGTNDLIIETPDSFEGGTIHINYNYNDNFAGLIDGQKADIELQEDLNTMLIDVPEGAHTIRIEYKDRLLMTGVAICIAGLVIFIGTSLVIKRRSQPA